MAKSLKNLVFIALVLAPSSSFGMEPEPPSVKIQTSDEQEFEIPLGVAKTSETLKGMIEAIREEAQTISLAEISGQQFDLLLLAMKSLAQLNIEKSQVSEKEAAQQLQRIVANLKSMGQSLDSQQLIQFIAGANFLNIPLVKPALEVLAAKLISNDKVLSNQRLIEFMAITIFHNISLVELAINKLAQRILNKDELQQLVKLKDTLKKVLYAHPAMQMLSLQHPGLNGVIESRDGKYLISWGNGTIKVWDKNTLQVLFTLQHPGVAVVIESSDGKNLISWDEGTIKIWDKSFQELLALQHPRLQGVIKNKNGNLISWSVRKGTIKIWDKTTFKEVITLQYPGLSGVIENRDGNLISWSWDEGAIKIWDKSFKGLITLQHPGLWDVIESRNGNSLISWGGDTMKIWDKISFKELITLRHQGVQGVIESRNGILLISWGGATIKIWGKNNLAADPISFSASVFRVIESKDEELITSSFVKNIHPEVWGFIESSNGNLISWGKGAIKIWDGSFFNPTPELVQLLLIIYFVSKGQAFELTAEELATYKATFNTLSPMIQSMLEKQAPDLIKTIKRGDSSCLIL